MHEYENMTICGKNAGGKNIKRNTRHENSRDENTRDIQDGCINEYDDMMI